AVFKPWSGRLRHIRDEKEARGQCAPHGETPSRRRFHPNYFYVPGTAFWLDRKTWQTIGPFDESLHTYWEDVDFSARAHLHGAYVGVHPETAIVHSVGKTCHKLPFYTQYLFQRNRRVVSQRYSPKWLRPWQSLYL